MSRLSIGLFMAAALLAGTAAPSQLSMASAAEDCTGDNCPAPPSSGGGRDCQSKKNEQTVS